MPDYPDTVADVQSWKPLPVPTGPAHLICQVQPIRVTFKTDLANAGGFILPVGAMLHLKAGDTGHIRPAEALGGFAVMETFG